MYSRIKYEIKIYENCSFNSVDKIQVVQNKLLKLVLGKDKMTPTDECYKCMNILKVDDTYEWYVLSFVNDIMARKHALYLLNNIVEKGKMLTMFVVKIIW